MDFYDYSDENSKGKIEPQFITNANLNWITLKKKIKK